MGNGFLFVLRMQNNVLPEHKNRANIQLAAQYIILILRFDLLKYAKVPGQKKASARGEHWLCVVDGVGACYTYMLVIIAWSIPKTS
ncbi:MAG: hypothetical protein AAF599_00090 [Bacteroidota bacterium]